ncbi:MAG: hypothetical protein IKQ73_02165 [Oscillospiraceae bacterium]|nr:hypothetical protein [Oscillospiraceae bacterium]
MKRIGKILLAAALVLALCASLCSCAALDEMKASRAELRKGADGRDVIVFRDSVYLPTDSLVSSRMPLHVRFYDTAYVADPDVPALLLDSFGIRCPYNRDASLMEYYGDYYVREDRYDELRALTQSSGPFSYCTEDWDETYALIHPMIPAGYGETLDTLTALADAGSDILPEVPDGYDYLFSRAFYRCDRDASFLIGEYYLIRVCRDGSVKETYIYNEYGGAVPVPAEYLPAVDRMIEELDLFESISW